MISSDSGKSQSGIAPRQRTRPRDPSGNSNPQQPARSQVERSDFIDIMATYPTGVTVVTTRHEDGRPLGLTVSAVSSVSADPPLLLICVDENSHTLPGLLAQGEWIVNFLKEGSESVGKLFAGKGDKFADVTWEWASNGVPCLPDYSLAYAICIEERRFKAGDHYVFVGRVVGGKAQADSKPEPLVYYDRAFRQLAPAQTRRE